MITHYLNINSYFPYHLCISDPDSNLCRSGRLLSALPASLANMELSRAPLLPIPPEVQHIYARFRPTPLFRATRFETALGTRSEIYVKDESSTPTGNHKANSAYLIAHLCKHDGLKLLTTETTGNWGVAFAMAATEFGLESISFVDAVSQEQRPGTCRAIEAQGGRVVIVKTDNCHQDLLTLSADAAIAATTSLEQAAYVFGSVYGYFVIPQSVMGLEAYEQLCLLDRHPTVVIGSCGGGANLLGVASPYLAEQLRGETGPRIISAESELCPILSRGEWGWHSIDTVGYYPALQTFGLQGLLGSDYIGGLGSTIVAVAAAYAHRCGLIEAQVFTACQAQEAARLFEMTEGKRVALETAYQLAAVIREARRPHQEVILVNVSSGYNEVAFYTSA